MKLERHGYPILTPEQARALDAATEADFGLPLV